MRRYEFILAVIILGCTSKPDQESIVKVSDTLRIDTLHNNTPLVEVKKDSINFENEVLHHFSSLVTKDTFKITVVGPSIDLANAHFQITTAKKQIILDEVFHADSLLSSSKVKELSVEEKKMIVATRIMNFFNEPNFHQPAIKDSYVFNPNHADKIIWNDLKSDPKTIGFSYTVGQEDSRFIGFSKKSKRVVVYYSTIRPN